MPKPLISAITAGPSLAGVRAERARIRRAVDEQTQAERDRAKRRDVVRRGISGALGQVASASRALDAQLPSPQRDDLVLELAVAAIALRRAADAVEVLP